MSSGGVAGQKSSTKKAEGERVSALLVIRDSENIFSGPGILSMVISWKFAQGPGGQFAFFVLVSH
jgi:hypothetical protein